MEGADLNGTPTSPQSAAPATQAANFLDVKLHGISGLPPGWLLDSGAPPIYNEHPFRYEVDVKVAGTTHTFRGGRLLQAIPLYSAFVEGATLGPWEGGGAGAGGSSGSEAAAAASQAGAEAVPHAVSAGQSAAERVEAAAEHIARDTSAAPVHDPTAPQQLLWILGPEADLAEIPADVTAKKDAKGAKGKAAAAAAPPPLVVEAVRPIIPDTTAPPPCVMRISLTLQQLAAFEEEVERAAPLSLVLRRVLRPNAPPEWEDPLEARYQAVIPVPLRPLTAPGSTVVTADVPLEPALTEAPREDEKGKKKAPPKKAKGALPACLTEELDPNEPHPYVAHKTTARITITCQSAITRLPEARPRPHLQPSDMIPRRLRPPQRAVEATKLFSGEVQALIRKIIADYRQHTASAASAAGDATDAATNAAAAPDPEELRASFLTYLHTSGQAHAYKQTLVPAVQAIVKEKFMRRPNPTREELDRVANELYAFLLDHLHSALNKELGGAASAAGGGGGASSGGLGGAAERTAGARWKRLALEAEVMHEFAAAAKYHQERIVHRGAGGGGEGGGGDGEDELPDVWCDYAEFCLRTRDVLRAEQGFREALALDAAHLPALLGYGALLLGRSRFKEAEVFLQAAVDTCSSALTWGCVGLYYDLLLLSLPDGPEDEAQRTLCLREGKYAVTQAMRATAEAATEGEEGGERCDTPEAVYGRLAQHLINLHLEDLANLCLAKAAPGAARDLLFAQLFYQTQQFDESAAILTEHVEAHAGDCQARLLLGDVYAAAGRSSEAEAQYDAALRIDPACGSGPACIRLGNMYVALGKYKDALGAFILGANAWPCGLTWLGVGVAYYRMDDMPRAEQAFNESNILNNLNPKTWAYLALVCLRQKREDEGDQAFNQAIKLGLSDSYLIAEIGAEQLRIGRPKIAEACFRRSLGLLDDCNTRMYLARALSTMKRFSEAREEFERVAQHTTNEVQRLKAEEQIAMISAA